MCVYIAKKEKEQNRNNGHKFHLANSFQRPTIRSANSFIYGFIFSMTHYHKPLKKGRPGKKTQQEKNMIFSHRWIGPGKKNDTKIENGNEKTRLRVGHRRTRLPSPPPPQLIFIIFTYIVRSSVRPSVRLSVRPSVCPMEKGDKDRQL